MQKHQIVKKRVRKMQEELPNLYPLYITEEQCRVVNKEVSKFLIHDCDVQWCVTSRIDNDDVYDESFIESIQKAISERALNKCVLSCSRGLQYDLRENIMLKYNRVSNHFITLVTETTCEANHILYFDHTKLNTYHIDVQSLDDGKIKWIEIVHECNQKNDTRYGLFNVIWDRKIFEQYPYIPTISRKGYIVYLGKIIVPTLIHAPKEMLILIYRKIKHKVW